MKIIDELKQLIESNPISISTVSKNNSPHTIYVMYAKVIHFDKVLITDNYMKKTKENILLNPNVSLTVLVGGAAYELVGVAKYFCEGVYVEKIHKIIENKAFPCKGAIVIDIKKIVKMG